MFFADARLAVCPPAAQATEIARAAGVAVETVYAAYHNMPTLLRQVWYATLRGDEEETRPLGRPEIRS